MEVYADYHTHTKYSHGTGSIRENIEAGIEAGLEEIAIADHGPASYSFYQLGVTRAETLLEIKDKVDYYNRLYPEIEVLAATEANIISLTGELDVPQSILQVLDKVLVGFHLFTKPVSWQAGVELIVKNLVQERLGINSQEIRQQNTELLIKVLNNYDIDIITHPGYQINIDTRVLAQEAVKSDVALEINVKHLPKLDYVLVAAQEGVNFSLGSDAHQPSRVGDLEPALEVARQAGLTANRIINVKQGNS